MAKNTPAAKTPAVKKSTKAARPAELDDEYEDEPTSGGAFFSIQKPLIHLIEEYLLTHPVAGKRMTLKAFCELSGMTVANMTAIINGNRWVAKCNRETIEKLAATLEIPVLQIYIMSGFITTEDVAYSSNINETVNAIYRMMVKDKNMAHRAPTEAVWNTWPMSAKLSVCMMYEAMLGKILLRYASA
jgi:hypothetical protein